MTHPRLQPESGNPAAAAEEEHEDASSPTACCCISCFRLMPTPPDSPPVGCAVGPGSPEPELLCASCILHLAGKSSKSPAVPANVGGALSPLPKLSLLVKAEAKCQDQLQLLRGQHEFLQQQRESLQATKRAKEETLATERALARQRRKHFLLIQERRKREEELKFQQFVGEEHTSCSEQEAGADKPKKKNPKPPKLDVPLQRRRSEPLAGQDATDVTLPHVAEPGAKLAETPQSHTSTGSDSAGAAEAHSASLYERRRQMMVCYSQDLSPLIDGRKPRRLPFPKPTAAVATTSLARRRQTPDNNAALVTCHHSKGQPHARKQGKSPAPTATKLRPLEEQKRSIKTRPQQHHASNQFEDFHARRNDEGGSKRVVASPLQQPPRRLVEHTSPLTAEIKPVSWAYKLAKDVLPQDDASVTSGFSAPLHPVAEEKDNGPKFTMFPLQHQLPSPTFPPSKPEVTVKASRWEYSAERLSSLLEKYNVSVSSVTAAEHHL